jgi:HEAT repeat protein
MPLTVNCSCGKSYAVRDELAGLKGKCPSCGTVLTVPGLDSVPESPAESVLTERAVETVRQYWPAARIDLCAVKLSPGADPKAIYEALRAETQSPTGPADAELFVTRGAACEQGMAFAFVGVLCRHGRKTVLPWFCQCILDLHNVRDHHLFFAMDHAIEDMLRPDGGAMQVAITAFEWVHGGNARAKSDSSARHIKGVLDNEARLPNTQSSSAGMTLEPLRAPIGHYAPAAVTPGDHGSGVRHESPVRTRVREAEALARAEEEESLLRQLRMARTVAQVTPSLQSPNPNLRSAAVEKLAVLKDHGAVGLLVHALNDDHSLVRRRAVEALGEFGDPRAIEMLGARLDDEDEDPKIREEAAWTLAKFRQPEAMQRVAPTLARWAKENSFRTAQAAEALAQLKDAEVAKLLVRQLPEDYEPDSGTLRALRGIGAPYIVGPLIQAVRSREYLTRTLAAELLGDARDPSAVATLMAAAKEDDKELRRAAIEALGKIGDMRAAPAFQEAAHDKSRRVRKAAVDALQAMGITWI